LKITKNINNETITFPTKDNDGNPLICEFGLTKYTDFQFLTLQELPEESPNGLIPRSVSIVLLDDLCGKYKPGDKIFITGVYKNVTTKIDNADKYGIKQYIIATNIEYLNFNESSKNEI